jgi:hypothetical protein
MPMHVSLQDSDVLNLGTGSVSWWEVNGVGCKPTYPTNLTSEVDPDPSRPLRPERVAGCFLDYQYVEVLHAALQCVLAVSWVLLIARDLSIDRTMLLKFILEKYAVSICLLQIPQIKFL